MDLKINKPLTFKEITYKGIFHFEKKETVTISKSGDSAQTFASSKHRQLNPKICYMIMWIIFFLMPAPQSQKNVHIKNRFLLITRRLSIFKEYCSISQIKHQFYCHITAWKQRQKS